MPLQPGYTLQPHQQRLTDLATQAAVSGDPFRVAAIWGTGSGKGIGALNAVERLGGTTSAIVPAALRPNLKGEAQRAFGRTDIPVHSYQAAVSGRAPQTNNLLIDESQRLNSPASTQAHAVTDLAMKARNVVLMTGTPVRNRPSEFAPLMSILTGTRITPDEFDKRYVGTETHRPGGVLGWLRGVPAVTAPALVNKDELRHLLAGHVDYHVPETPPVGVTHETHEAEMTPRQAELYSGMFGKLPMLMRWKMRFNYPLSDEELVRARSFLTGPRQVALSDLPYRSDGDPYRAFLNSGKLTKAHGLLKKTLDADPRTRAIVYSNFPEAGLRPYAAALAREGVPHATFDGKLSDAERKRLVDDFNAGKTRVAFVGPAGAEGISLKGAQLTQVLDGAWTKSRTQQAIGRGVRFDSHVGLPDELKRMTIQHFVAKVPLGVRDRILESMGFDRSHQRHAVDDYLGNLADKKDVLNRQLMDLLKEVGTQNRAKVAAELSAVLSGREVERLTEIAARSGLVSYTKAGALISVPELRAESARRREVRLNRYVCPACGGPNALNGDPVRKTQYRGGGECRDCGARFSIVGRKMQPIGPGPVIGHLPDDHPFLRDRKEAAPKIEAAGWVCETCGHWTAKDPPANKCATCSGDPVPVLGRLEGVTDKWPEDRPTLWVNGPEKRVWIETGDWHESDAVKTWYADVRRKFKGWTVEGESEAGPRNDAAWVKAAAIAFDDTMLRAAKQESDRGGYEGYTNKAMILRAEILKDPAGWYVDQDDGGHVVGLRHRPSGWKFHLPRRLVRDLPITGYQAHASAGGSLDPRQLHLGLPGGLGG